MDGVIFDLKEFAVYDGPGLRQTVFLKGCPMRCQWCHNPEGLIRQPQLMVSVASCTGCGKCRQPCENDPCTACGKCILYCPLGLRKITGERISAERLAETLLKNDSYYSRYGGGVTFSGGEPLTQGEFLVEVIRLIPEMHKMVETCGCVSPELFREVVRQLDYVFMDLKIMDPQKHRQFTGVENHQILENARWLCGSGIPFKVRVPLIPGVTDRADNLEEIARFLQGAKALEGVELLPYNKLTGAKYPMVGMEYRPEFDETVPVELHDGIFTQYGIRSMVL